MSARNWRPDRPVCAKCGAVHQPGRRQGCSGLEAARAFWSRLIRRLAAIIADHYPGSCGCPLCSRAERRARLKIGMPLLHPERITRNLSAAQEELLAQLAQQMWPDDEYVAIIREPGTEPGQEAG